MKGILSFDVGIVNLAFCLVKVPIPTSTRKKTVPPTPEAEAATGTILDWDIICLAEDGEKAKRIPLATLGRRLFARLDTIWEQWKDEMDYVLIENQPSRLNGHMKSVQMLIYAYFLYKSETLETLLVNASGKLKTHEVATAQTLLECPCPYADGYKKNKWMSIRICDYYIRHDEALKERMATHKKKDDLCDALLQAMGWYHKNFKSVLGSVVSVPVIRINPELTENVSIVSS